MKRRAVLLLLAVLPLLFLAGCGPSAPPWLKGDWRFDSLATSRRLTPDQVARLNGLAGMPLIPAPEYLELVIDASCVACRNAGQGPTLGYHRLVAWPLQCRLRMADGAERTYHRDGAEIYQLSEDEVPIKVYYQRRSH